MNIKERWKLAEELSPILCLNKKIVFNGLTKIIQTGLLEKIKTKDQEAIKTVLKLEWYGHKLEYKNCPHGKELVIDCQFCNGTNKDIVLEALARVLESGRIWIESLRKK